MAETTLRAKVTFEFDTQPPVTSPWLELKKAHGAHTLANRAVLAAKTTHGGIPKGWRSFVVVVERS